MTVYTEGLFDGFNWYGKSVDATLAKLARYELEEIPEDDYLGLDSWFMEFAPDFREGLLESGRAEVYYLGFARGFSVFLKEEKISKKK